MLSGEPIGVINFHKLKQNSTFIKYIKDQAYNRWHIAHNGASMEIHNKNKKIKKETVQNLGTVNFSFFHTMQVEQNESPNEALFPFTHVQTEMDQKHKETKALDLSLRLAKSSKPLPFLP